jgi:hypothetical protein
MVAAGRLDNTDSQAFWTFSAIVCRTIRELRRVAISHSSFPIDPSAWIRWRESISANETETSSSFDIASRKFAVAGNLRSKARSRFFFW